MNRFAAAITSTYYTIIFFISCVVEARTNVRWDSDKARELSVRVRDVCVYGRPAFENIGAD